MNVIRRLWRLRLAWTLPSLFLLSVGGVFLARLTSLNAPVEGGGHLLNLGVCDEVLLVLFAPGPVLVLSRGLIMPSLFMLLLYVIGWSALGRLLDKWRGRSETERRALPFLSVGSASGVTIGALVGVWLLGSVDELTRTKAITDSLEIQLQASSVSYEEQCRREWSKYDRTRCAYSVQYDYDHGVLPKCLMGCGSPWR